MADRFPDQTAKTIGQFQVVSNCPADADVPQRTGVLRFRDNAIELEVSPSFTPVVSWTEKGRGTYSGRPAQGRDANDAAVLGAIASQPGDVSLWGGDAVSRQLLGFSVPEQEEQRSREVLSADRCLVGAHFPSDKTEFSSVTLDVTGLRRFADLPSIRVEKPERGMFPLRWVLDPPDAATGTTAAPFQGMSGLFP